MPVAKDLLHRSWAEKHFVILMPNTTVNEAYTVGERIRPRLEKV